ncbi:YHYH protein [Neolewinella aurantiaca]|uniref:YHYH protein n=1 Tax=Neolewinella aurantiaca TaxID=2602767 RepID=A0A5C7FTX1_9BACT|nr:YHYH protein [Neolewinella aurantiaca]TXF89720.1 YHYH protein [Neolewinella aurantiaca]
MKYLVCASFGSLFLLLQSCNNQTARISDPDEVVVEVNPSHFLTNGGDFTIETVACTLSDGTKTKCYKITTRGLATDHAMGPWCPETISDGPDKSGKWIKDGELVDADGDFLKNLATIYDDPTWIMYDENGNIKRSETKEDCMKLAGATLLDEFTNHCIECLPSYISEMSKTYLLPVKPVRLVEPTTLGGGGPPPGGERPSGPPPSGPPPGGRGGGPASRGIAFNGVVFDAPAPLSLILSGYTIAPFDDAGGHINMDAGYHYHAATGATKEIEQPDGHAPMIGYAMDGFGLYARLNTAGEEPTDLDDCRGHYDDVRGYHYHVDAAGKNNFIGCFSGATVR